ncbi:YybS family protein [Metabacillus herbersteinensis]|uniref:YybS family protein n=1 Tax=Metabacillus herbersteinensis TaxID=283816 RepID=A0ABV6GHB7_9BACI
MKKAHVLTEGAILLALFTLFLLITLYVPIIGGLLMFVLPLPFILFTIRHGVKLSLTLLIGGILLTILVGSLVALPLAIICAICGIVMGYFYEKNQSSGAIIGGAIAFLISIVLVYIAAVAFFSFDPFQEAIALFKNSSEQSQSLLSSLGQEANKEAINEFEEQLANMQYLIPSIIASIAALFPFLFHVVSVPIMRRLNIKVNSIKPFREWMLPKSLIWYYLGVSLFMFIKLEPGSFGHLAVYNIFYILQLLLVIQGISFVFYYTYVKKLSKTLPIIVVISSLFLPIILYLVRILGIIDLGFSMRERLTKK